MEPFKWGCFEANHAKYGETAKVVAACFDSNNFWKSLKSSHEKLQKKYEWKENSP